MNEHFIEFNDVSYSYEEEYTEENAVVHKLNFYIDSGEFVAILGRNGSGKSTVAKLCNGIFLPSSGCVTVDGVPTTDETQETQIRKKVGVVFQNPDNQIVASIVEEDVAFGPENLGLSPEEIRRRVDNSMKATGIYDLRLRETHRLSGGQKQRVAIAGIIAMLPECIVLDEPTAMLDPSGRKDVLATINKLNREMNKSVLLITHYMEEAVNADRIILIDNGNIEAIGTPAEIFADDNLLNKCGLEVPDVTALSKYLYSAGLKIPQIILTEDELIGALKAL